MAAQWRVPVLCRPEYDSAAGALRLLRGVGGVPRAPSRRGGAARSGAGPALPRPLLWIANHWPSGRLPPKHHLLPDTLLRGLLEFEAFTWVPASASRYLTALLDKCARL